VPSSAGIGAVGRPPLAGTLRPVEAGVRRRLSGGRWGGGPDLGGAPGGGGLVPGGSAGAVERVECLLDAFGGEVAVQQVAELGAGEPAWGAGQRGVDLFSERVTGGVADCPGGGASGVVPERERGVEVFWADCGGAVEQCVDQREADGVVPRRGR
jgi:hypothetical protein